MFCRHLGARVFDDTAPILCADCNTQMDLPEGHASDLCNKGLGWRFRHEGFANVLAKHVFKAAGVGVCSEVPFLLRGLDARAVDILVHPRSSVDDSSRGFLSPWSMTQLFPRPSNGASSPREPGKRVLLQMQRNDGW
eukprot:GFKZ01004479.1.p1 GENE.GFKZ01004479.1~~GFKZ01004479.1.p1  ORF type:complete len:137 (+),score=4.96 GFKZ01004479.1:228-638(+)